MLIRAEGGVSIVACNTCRASGNDGGKADGARFVAALRAVKAGDPAYDGVAVQEMPCLFACSAACTIHLRAPDKIGYVLGRFEPDEAAARAILDYARAYAASEWGEVAFCDWPEGVKGHFITRMPPPGFVVE